MSIAIPSPTPNQGHVTVRDFYDNTVSSQPHLSTTSDIVVLTAPLIVEFFQYGLIDWDQFHSCLRAVIVTSDWAVFEYDENKLGQRGSACPVGHGLVEPGTYILLRAGKLFDSRIFEDRIHKVPPDGHPITVEFTTLTARPRHPTVSNTSQRVRQLPPTILTQIPLTDTRSGRALSYSHTRPRSLLSHQWTSGRGGRFQPFHRGTHLSTSA